MRSFILQLQLALLSSFSVVLLLGCPASKPGEGERMGIDSILWWSPIDGVMMDTTYDPPIFNSTGLAEDIDKNGRMEVILSGGKKLRVFNGEDGVLKWVVNKTDESLVEKPGVFYYPETVISGDIDGDGSREVLTLTEGWVDSIDGNPLPTSVPVSYLSSFNSNGEKIWSSKPGVYGEYKDFSMMDVDKDGVIDIFLCSSTHLLRISGKTGEIIWKYGNSWFDELFGSKRDDINFNYMALGDVDDDGYGDVVINESKSKSIIAFNGLDGSKIWTSSGGSDTLPWITLLDIDSDSRLDIVTREGKIISDGVEKYDLSSLKVIENPYPEEETLKSMVIFPSLGYFNIDGSFTIFSDIVFSNVGFDSGGKITKYYGKQQYISAFNIFDGLLWKRLLSEDNRYVEGEFESAWSLVSFVVSISNVLFVDLNNDGISDILNIENGIIQARDGISGEGLFWYGFAADDSVEWGSVSIVKIFSVFDMNSDGKSEILALAYNSQWSEITRLIALKTDSVYPANPELKPWPMEKHDPYRTGNYHFVP